MYTAIVDFTSILTLVWQSLRVAFLYFVTFGYRSLPSAQKNKNPYIYACCAAKTGFYYLQISREKSGWTSNTVHYYTEPVTGTRAPLKVSFINRTADLISKVALLLRKKVEDMIQCMATSGILYLVWSLNYSFLEKREQGQLPGVRQLKECKN